MGGVTTRLGLILPAGGEPINVDDVNANSLRLDKTFACILVNDGVTPPDPDLYDGAIVMERNSGKAWVFKKSGAAFIKLPLYVVPNTQDTQYLERVSTSSAVISTAGVTWATFAALGTKTYDRYMRIYASMRQTSTASGSPTAWTNQLRKAGTMIASQTITGTTLASTCAQVYWEELLPANVAPSVYSLVGLTDAGTSNLGDVRFNYGSLYTEPVLTPGT